MERRTVPKSMNSTARSSVRAYVSEPARHMQPKSGPPCSSFVVLPQDAHELSEADVPARATESGQGFKVDKPEYPSHNFTELPLRLQQQQYTQKESLSDISHELRAPISRIRLLLERARQSPQEICGYLARIEENILRMEALTTRLLDFSQLELIEGSFVKEPCDLA